LCAGVRVRAEHLQGDQGTSEIERRVADLQPRADRILLAVVRGTRGQDTVGQRQRDGGELGPATAACEVLLLHVRLPDEVARGHETVERAERHAGQRSVAQARLEDAGTRFQGREETRVVPRSHGQQFETMGGQHVTAKLLIIVMFSRILRTYVYLCAYLVSVRL